MATHRTKPKTANERLEVRLASELMGAQVHSEEKETKEKRPYHTRNPEKIEAQRKMLKEYQWKKGQSGNPAGRPPNPVSLTAILNRKLADHPEDAEAIVDALINLGMRPNISQLSAVDKLFDRVDGKVIERHEISGELPVRIQFIPAEQLLAQRVIGIEPAPETLELKEGG